MRARAVLIACGIISAGLVFLYLWLNSQAILLRAQFSEITLELDELHKEVLSLEYEVSRAFSPEVIEEKARELGMIPFDDEHTIYIRLVGEGRGD